MKILQPLPGDSATEHLSKLYHRVFEKNEPILTTFNGVTILFLPDEHELEYLKLDIHAVKADHLRDVERREEEEKNVTNVHRIRC